jgi:hypothetical protein
MSSVKSFLSKEVERKLYHSNLVNVPFDYAAEMVQIYGRAQISGNDTMNGNVTNTKVVEVIIKRILSGMLPLSVSHAALDHQRCDNAHFFGDVDKAQHQEGRKCCCWNGYKPIGRIDLELSHIESRIPFFWGGFVRGLPEVQEDTA